MPPLQSIPHIADASVIVSFAIITTHLGQRAIGVEVMINVRLSSFDDRWHAADILCRTLTKLCLHRNMRPISNVDLVVLIVFAGADLRRLHIVHITNFSQLR